MKNYYVVVIEIVDKKTGKKKRNAYVAVHREDGRYPLLYLVKSKSSASKFETRGMARLASEHLYENYWKHQHKLQDYETEYWESRDIEMVKGRKS